MDNKLELILEKNELTNGDVTFLKNYLEKASSVYYNSNQKMLTDSDFDLIKDKLDQYTTLDVGAAPIKGQVNALHKYPDLVGSLNKVSNLVEFDSDFLDSLIKKDSVSGKVTLKFDGNSLVGEYDKDGNPVTHLTRGRDGKGKDLSSAFANRKLNNPFKKPFGIKYEVIVRYSVFNQKVKELGVSYASPRSFVAGKLSDDDVKDYVELFDLVPIGFSFGGEHLNIEDQFKNIKAVLPDDYNTFIEPFSLEFKNYPKDKIISSVEEFQNDILSTRDFLDFMIDGLVFEISDTKYSSIPAVNHRPKHAIAIKFPYMEKESFVTGFEFDLSTSHTGVITPMVLFNPVVFNGAEQKRVSIANYKRFTELQLGIGSPVLIEYHGDVLSYLTKMDTTLDITPEPFIEQCPCCNTKVAVKVNDKGEKTIAYCPNADCSQKISGLILNYIKTLDIKGIKESTIEKIVNNVEVHSPSDLYLLDEETLLSIDGFKEKTVSNIISALSSKAPMDYELLGSLGITNFKTSKAKLLLSRIRLNDMFEVPESFNDYFYKTPQFKLLFLSIEGFSIKTYNAFMEEFPKVEDELFALIENITENYNIEINETQDMFKKTSSESYTFVITGSISKWTNRKELTTHLENLGHKVTNSVTKNTDYLVNNDSTSSTGKNKKAKELGVQVITEEELLELL